MTDWQRLGGEPGVRALIDALVDRFASDLIIGFHFEGRDLERVKVNELGLASVHLGGELRYQGRPLASSHRPLRINKGQFRRRLALLRTVLRERAIEPDIIDRWVAHDARFEAAITDGTDCVA